MKKDAVRRRFVLISAGALLLAAVLLLPVLVNRPEVCPFDNREIHSGSRAVVELAGERQPTCCIRCALTAKRQGIDAQLVEVSDFVSSEPLPPDAAFYVSGSPIVLCERHEPKFDADKHVHQKVFDRCEPSVFAFARRERAEDFARANGGVVQRLPELLEEAGGKR